MDFLSVQKAAVYHQQRLVFIVARHAFRYIFCQPDDMPFKTDESKRIDMALAICAANYGLADGSFDYSLADGTILFRLTSSYRGIALSEELLEYMLMVAVSTVNEYNNKFFMISEGELTVQQFIESEQASD